MVQGEGAAERIELLNDASFIYTRETKALGILKNGGVKTSVLEFGPDGCFGIDVRDDERGLATMKKLGLEEKHVVNLESFWNADEAASIFARAHTIVCHEPHSPIIALANGTPIIHACSEFHSPKCRMFKDIGVPEWLLEIDETPVEKVAETLFAIDTDCAAAQAKVKKAMAHVHERFAGSMKHLKSVLS